MRTMLVGVVSGLVALVGFASTANASATIDLLWNGTATDTAGTTSSQILTLDVVLTAGPNGSNGASLSVEFNGGKLEYVSSLNFLDGVNFGVAIAGPSTYNGSNQVNAINAGALPPYLGTGLGAGLSQSIGTIVFHKTAGPGGVSNLDVAFTATEAILDGGGNNITGISTLNGATITNAAVPEPGTVSLLALGLGGLALAGRRRS